MTKINISRVALWFIGVSLIAVSCGGSSRSANDADGQRPSIVVTYSILGAVVQEVVGDLADVAVLVPNGADPHEWQPSAKDIEKLNNADLVVVNGLGLESGLDDVIHQAADDNVQIFVATDHVKPRLVGEGEGADPTDEDQAVGAQDPHIWTDPAVMADVVEALGEALSALNIEVTEQAAKVSEDLLTLDHTIEKSLMAIADSDRKLVTGHESLGYFARRYNFSLIGAIIPNLSSKAEVSAADMTALKEKISSQGVHVIFTELGTSSDVADSLASDAGVEVVELSTHVLPADGSYETFMTELASTILNAIKP